MTHTCPGLCGRTNTGVIFACPQCARLLPQDLRVLITTTWWAEDWPAHSRAMADALLWLAHNHHARPGRVRRTDHSGQTGGDPA